MKNNLLSMWTKSATSGNWQQPSTIGVERPPAPASANPGHIPSLDGIRAISFLLVFVAHIGYERVVPGGLGVTIFFFLSGFLITTLLRLEYNRHDRIHLAHFWLRRVLRILPPFYLLLGLAYLLPVFSGTFTVSNAYALLAQSLHVTNYWIIANGYAGFPELTGTGVYWSLAVEEHFYLVFPFLYIWLRRRDFAPGWQALLIGLLCATVLAWRCYLVFHVGVQLNRTYMGSDTRVDSILFGCLLAVYGNPVLDPQRGQEKTWAFLLLPLAVLGLLASLLIRVDAFRETVRYSLQGLALIPVFIAAIRFPHWPIFAWLNSKLMKFLGSLSYSLYLVHLGVIFVVQNAIGQKPPWVYGVIALPISVLASWTIYKLVEKPCAALRRRLVD
jgi:peptidoglycan/LPS O-acetylase OafA/YrhL